MLNQIHKRRCEQFSVIFLRTILVFLAFLLPLLIPNPSAAAVHPVVIQGDVAPGMGVGATFGIYRSDFSINNSGQVTFVVPVESGSPVDSDQTLWREDSGTLSLIARQGSDAPGIPGDVRFLSFVNPNINDSGRVAFVGHLVGAEVEQSKNSDGMWKGLPGALSLIARQGDLVPGGSGDKFGAFSERGSSSVLFNSQSQVAFSNRLNGTNAVSVWQEHVTGLSMVAKAFAAVPGEDAIYSSLSSPVLNDSGEMVFSSYITGNLEWSSSNTVRVLHEVHNGNVSIIYKAGDPVPGVSGAEFDDFGDFDMNASGKLVFSASIHGESIDFTNNYGIWSDVSGNLALVARKGAQAPGAPVGAVFSYVSDKPVVNDNGQIAFTASLENGAGGVDNSNRYGIWYETDGRPELIVRTGDRAPGTPDGVVFSALSFLPEINRSGQICFMGSLTGPTTNYLNDSGIWLYDPASPEPLLVVREGDRVTLSTGESVTFSSLGSRSPASYSGGSDGRARILTDSGKIVFGALLMDLRYGLFIADPFDVVARLYFPHINCRATWGTEICVVNPGDSVVSGVFKAYKDTGVLVFESEPVALPAHGRKGFRVGETFANPDNIGYIIFESDSSAVNGYTRFNKGVEYRVAVPAVPDSEINTDDIYISHIASSDTWWTEVSLLNTTSSPKTLTIEFNNGKSVTKELASNEHSSFTIRSLFSDLPQPDIRSAVIKHGSGVIGQELFCTIGDMTQLSGVLLKDDTESRIYYPHIASDNVWWTGVAAYNPYASVTTITITPYSVGGTPLTPTSFEIDAQGKYIGAVSSLNLPAETAWIQIDATQPITGFELFGTQNGAQLAGYSGVGISGYSGIFAKIEKSAWTGIAFANTEEYPAEVSLTAYNDSGVVRALGTVTLTAHQKLVNVAEDMFADANISDATYIAYSSDREIVGFQINGSFNNLMLDALPSLSYK